MTLVLDLSSFVSNLIFPRSLTTVSLINSSGSSVGSSFGIVGTPDRCQDGGRPVKRSTISMQDSLNGIFAAFSCPGPEDLVMIATVSQGGATATT